MNPDEEMVMLSGRVPEELKRLVDADKRDNQDVLQAALWREYGGEREGALKRRLEEKRRRRTIVKEERESRDNELDEIDRDIEALEAKLEQSEGKSQAKKEELYRKVRMVPKEESHPVVQNAATELDMDAERVIEEAYNK